MRDALGDVLLTLARGAIASEFGHACPPVAHDALDRPGATFVTLMQDGDLRGCIGSLEPVQALRDDVWQNGRRAAFGDPRFPPVTAAELESLDVEVSLIGPSERIAAATEAELIARLRPGTDGVILRYGRARGTFLPQVWEALPDAASFLRELKRKAGLPGQFWHPDVEVWRYTVDKWTERERALAVTGGAPNE